MSALRVRLPESLRRALESKRVASLFRPDYPPFAVEVSSQRLIGVALERSKTGIALVGSRVVALAPGVVAPSLGRPAIGDAPGFREALRQTGFTGRFSLLLPDRVAKLTFVELEQEPGSIAETTELIRWKLKRSTPFRVEDGRISFEAFPGNGVTHCLVSLVHEQVVQQFEEIVGELGYEAGLIDVSSLNLWNLVEAALPAEEAVLLLNITEDSGSALVARGGRPVFIRCKSPAGMEALSFEEFRTELHPTLLYYQDRLGGEPIRRAVVRAPAAVAAELQELLASRFDIESRLVGLGSITAAPFPEGLDAGMVAPAVGAALGR
jgi:hypothetical protein